MLDLLPDQLPPQQTWKPLYPAKGSRRGRVALLTGCAQSVLDPDINTATIQVLTANGIEVVVPPEQSCCGALSWHVGNQDAAQKFAYQNVNAFPHDVDAIVTNAAGCGSGMQEYGLICAGTDFESSAKQVQEKVCDVSAYLQKVGWIAPLGDRNSVQKIAYHDACHLASAQGVTAQPRELLRRIPGAALLEIPDSQICCGSAGTYNVEQPELAGTLGLQKAESILSVAPDLVASGNIGCLTQVATHLRRLGSDIPVLHTMQVLRDALPPEHQ